MGFQIHPLSFLGGVLMNNFTATEKTDSELMKLAKKRVNAKREFIWHFASYVLVNSFIVFIYLITSGFGYFWPIWSIAGWGLGLAFHGVSVMLTLSDVTGKDKVMEEYNRLKEVKNTETPMIDLRDDRSN